MQILSKNHIYYDCKIRNIWFYEPISLGFTETITKDCEFITPVNLIFHNTVILDCSFQGSLQNVVFDSCRLKRCSFVKATLTHVSFLGNTKTQESTGLPSDTLQPQALPYAKFKTTTRAFVR